ncbi:hypothetical protein J3F83DRAFT_294732 [Trichoderma novae-zelandiae]
MAPKQLAPSVPEHMEIDGVRCSHWFSLWHGSASRGQLPTIDQGERDGCGAYQFTSRGRLVLSFGGLRESLDPRLRLGLIGGHGVTMHTAYSRYEYKCGQGSALDWGLPPHSNVPAHFTRARPSSSTYLFYIRVLQANLYVWSPDSRKHALAILYAGFPPSTQLTLTCIRPGISILSLKIRPWGLASLVHLLHDSAHGARAQRCLTPVRDKPGAHSYPRYVPATTSHRAAGGGKHACEGRE